MSEKPEALQAAESLEQAIQFYLAGLENSDNHMTLLAFAAAELRRQHAKIERLMEALEIIAGYRQCVDPLMGNLDVAEATLRREYV